MRSKLLILLFGVICVFIIFNRNEQAKNQYVSDKCGYYLYLPATFIYHDLRHLSFYPALDSAYGHTLSLHYSLYDVNGNKLNKYPLGVAVLSAPAFFVAHVYCLATHTYPADGFSTPYQVAGLLGCILWVIAGLFVLRQFLGRYFCDTIVAITLCCIALGTNLYAYTAFEGGMSHAYSFVLFSCLLYATDIWYSSAPKKRTSIFAGLAMGLIFIVRPVNIIAFIIPLLWRVNDLASFRERIGYWKKNAAPLLLVLLSALAVAMIQFSYWKYITGHWLIDSYPGEAFDLLHPHLINGLFSYQKGWFLYTPMAVLGFAGLYYLWKKDRQTVPALTLFFLVMIYVVFSWNTWWYGCGFSCRPMVDVLGFLALPLAAVNAHFYAIAGKAKKAFYFVLISSLIALNVFQTYQYSMGLLDCGKRMTAKQYWYIFGKANPKAEDYQKYLSPDD